MYPMYPMYPMYVSYVCMYPMYVCMYVCVCVCVCVCMYVYVCVLFQILMFFGRWRTFLCPFIGCLQTEHLGLALVDRGGSASGGWSFVTEKIKIICYFTSCPKTFNSSLQLPRSAQGLHTSGVLAGGGRVGMAPQWRSFRGRQNSKGAPKLNKSVS